MNETCKKKKKKKSILCRFLQQAYGKDLQKYDLLPAIITQRKRKHEKKSPSEEKSLEIRNHRALLLVKVYCTLES